MSGPLFSLLIPTRNRAHTAAILVREVLTFLSEDSEVVVQDCGTDGELALRIADLMSDPRLRYEHTELVPMTENWNRGMRRCRGEYVSIIGDDDGIHREIVPIARWAKTNNVEALSWPFLPSARYYWPDHHVSELAGTCNMYRYTGALHKYQAPERLQRSLRLVGYMDLRGMPYLYHGLVRRSLVEQMQYRPGYYFDGVNPDVYAQYFLASLAREVWWVDYPISIVGISAKSNSGMVTRGNTTESAAYYGEYKEVHWPLLAPLADKSLGYQANLEGICCALTRAGRQELLKQLDVARYYAQAIYYGGSARTANLLRYFRASASVDRRPVQSLAALVKAFVQGAAIRYLKAKPIPEMEECKEPELVKQFRGIRDIAQLLRLQERALDDLQVKVPWGAEGQQSKDAVLMPIEKAL